MTDDERIAARFAESDFEFVHEGRRTTETCECGREYTVYWRATHDQSKCYGCRHKDASNA